MEQIFRRTSPNLANCKERRVPTSILPLLDTNGSVKESTVFLLGHALWQSSRTKFSVAWLEICRPVMRHYHIGEIQRPFRRPHIQVMRDKKVYESALPNSTSMAQQHCSYPVNYHQTQPKLDSTKRRHQQLWPTLTPRINRIISNALIELTPNIAILLGVHGTRSTLCVLDVVCSYLVCFFFECVCCYFVLVLVLASRP
jgi:hypothetical protein